MNPLHDEDMHAIMAANVLNGTDRNCKGWTNKFRDMATPLAITKSVGDGLPGASSEDADARRRAREERRRRRG